MSYEYTDDDCMCHIDDEGQRTTMCNFAARITEEIRYRDERDTHTILSIEGKQAGDDLPPVQINAQDFPGMTWVVPSWGISCVVMPGGNVRENLRTAIQLNSKPTKKTIYTHTGWINVNGHHVYLHNKGAVTPEGTDKSLNVELPPELRNYELDTTRKPQQAGKAILSLLDLAEPKITWPLIAAMIIPIHGSVDFATHITGRTGTFKSEIASLLQSAYGPEMDARHLPGSWSSTANALEAQAYRAKNALFTVDDFIPSGTSWQVRAYQKTADQILRGQGNQAGRARLTDVSNLQTTMYPRGMILSTGEDTPEGHSIRARMVILELSPGDVDVGVLTKCQADRELFSTALGHYVKCIAGNYPETKAAISKYAKQFRDKHVDIGHTRTPGALGRMIASVEHFLAWSKTVKAIDEKRYGELRKQAYQALLEAANGQAQYLMDADPCEAFCESIRHIISAHIGHFRTKDGGIPKSPELLGWTREATLGDLPTYKSHGKCVGWVSWDSDEVFIDITTAYNDIRKHSNNAITFTRQTMLKRLKDAGLLTRTDAGRQRNSIRIVAETHPRNVLAMSLSQTLAMAEKPNE